jgi:hypothetical protein
MVDFTITDISKLVGLDTWAWLVRWRSLVFTIEASRHNRLVAYLYSEPPDPIKPDIDEPDIGEWWAEYEFLYEKQFSSEDYNINVVEPMIQELLTKLETDAEFIRHIKTLLHDLYEYL